MAFENGVFEIADVPPGSYRLEVVAFGFSVNDAAREIAVASTETADLGGLIMMRIDEGGPRTPIVEGTVRDANSGIPIPAVAVRADCLDGICTVQRASTGPDGANRIPIPTLAATRFRFAVPDYHIGSVLIERTPLDKPIRADVRLQRE